MSQSEIRKLAATITVSDEMLQDNRWTMEDYIAAAKRARLERFHQQEAELLYGADLNPCIVLGEN